MLTAPRLRGITPEDHFTLSGLLDRAAMANTWHGHKLMAFEQKDCYEMYETTRQSALYYHAFETEGNEGEFFVHFIGSHGASLIAILRIDIPDVVFNEANCYKLLSAANNWLASHQDEWEANHCSGRAYHGFDEVFPTVSLTIRRKPRA